MSEFILQMKAVSKRFPGVLALDNVHLDVKKGEVHLLAGENGAGKSTLVKILAGAYKKDSGQIVLNGQAVDHLTPKYAQELGISIIYQEFNLVPYLSVAENIFLGREILSDKIPGKIKWDKMYSAAQKILDDLHVDIQAKTIVRELGVAQQQMVEVAKVMSLKSEIIIMDEPTASLSSKEIEGLFLTIRKLKEKGISIIYISHRLEEFNQIGDRVTVMRDGKTIKTLNIQDTNTDELIKLMVGRELKEKFPKISMEIGDEVLKISNLTTKKLLKNISFSLHAGEILGVAGLVGAGRTEMARAIFGLDHIESGQVIVNGVTAKIKHPREAINAGIGFITEDRKAEGLVLTLDVGSNITLAGLNEFTKGIHINLKKERSVINEFISKLNIKTFGSSQKALNLSGGNQQKVVIAKWLLSKSKIFIFDEPTRGIDVGAKTEVYNLINELLKGGAAVLFISSELPEILGMSDRLIVMCRGEITAELQTKETTQEKILYFATGGNKYSA
jgi:ribose transport system ATP-binding protein